MKSIKTRFRAYLSAALACSLVMVFSLGSLASESAAVGSGADPVTAQGPTGVLNVRGNVTVNGNPAASGGTVVSGNSIATGDNGSATIELGPLGRIELRPNTGITTTSLSPGSEALTLDRCGSVTVTFGPGVAGTLTDPNHDQARVQVISGQVHVKQNGKEQDLTPGQSVTLDSLEEISSAGGTTFVVSCGQQAGPALYGQPGGGGSSRRKKWAFIVPIGLAGLGGLAYGIHQAVSGEDEAVVSPSVP